MAGGGIGEAALIGAVIGGGTSALSGRDPLKGALLGGITGGAGAGISGLLGGAGAAGAGAATAEGAMSSLAGTAGYDAALAAGTPLSEVAGLSSLADTAGGMGALGYTTPQAVALTNAGYTPALAASAPLEAASLVGAPNAVAASTQTPVFNALKSLGSSIGDNQKGTTTQALKDVGSSFLTSVKDNPVPYGLAAAVPLALLSKNQQTSPEAEKYTGPLSKFKYDPNTFQPYTPQPPNPVYQPVYNSYGLPTVYAAAGGMTGDDTDMASVGSNLNYPMANVVPVNYSSSWHSPAAKNMLNNEADVGVNPMTGQMNFARGGVAQIPNHMAAIDNYRAQAAGGQYAQVLSKAKSGDWNAMLALNQLEKTPNQNYAGGGIADLGGYSDGGRMLKGPGDGMSDSIPATIANKRPARLANEEFVVPADVVSGLGNGSSEAGAKQLYAMMDRVRKARTGTKKQGREINPTKYMPA